MILPRKARLPGRRASVRGIARGLGALAVASLAWVWASPAYAEEPVRAVVRVITPTDRDLLRRARGQTNDLNLEIVEVEDDALEPRMTGQMATADREANEHGARVVVWFQAEDDTVLVHVLIASTGRVLVRRVVASPPSRSATLEAAALVVRAALRAIAAGATIGVTRAEALVEAEPPPPSPSPPAPRSDPERAPPAPPDAREAPQPSAKPPSPWISFVGVDAVYNGVTTQKALTFGGRADVGIFELGMAVRVGFPSEHPDTLVTAQITQHTGALLAGIPLRLSPDLRLCACLEVGATAFRRATLAASASVQPTAPRWTFSPMIGPSVRVAWRGIRLGGAHLGAGLTGGIDVVPNTPALGYGFGPDHDFVGRRRLWAVEPRAQLTLELTIP